MGSQKGQTRWLNWTHDEWLRAEDLEGAKEMVEEFKVTEWFHCFSAMYCVFAMHCWPVLSAIDLQQCRCCFFFM